MVVGFVIWGLKLTELVPCLQRPQLVAKGDVSMTAVWRMTFLSLFTLRIIIYNTLRECAVFCQRFST